MKLRDLIVEARQLRAPDDRVDVFELRRAQLPALVRAIGNEIDALEGRLRYLGECRGIALELTDIGRNTGGNWLSRASVLNGVGDVGPWLESAAGAISRIWTAAGLLRGDVDDAELSRETFEKRHAAAPGIDGLDVFADVLDRLAGVIATLDEWGPPPPPAPKTKAKPVAAAA